MFRKLFNYKLVQRFRQYLPTIENNVNISNQIMKWNYQQVKVCSTAPIDTLYSSNDPKKDKELKFLQTQVKAIEYFKSDKIIRNAVLFRLVYTTN